MATFMAKWSSDYAGQSGHIHYRCKILMALQRFMTQYAHTMSTTKAFPRRTTSHMNDFAARCPNHQQLLATNT